MVFLVREGFDQVVQKRKKIKIGPCATTFMGLEGFYGGWKVGGVHWLEVQKLESAVESKKWDGILVKKGV